MDDSADSKTLSYYNNHVEEVYARYEALEGSGIARYFPTSFTSGSRILDVGAGSGRDLRELLKLGFDAYGVEPADKMREMVIANHPQLKHRLFAGSLPNELTSYVKYDGIVCSAVLMHLPSNLLFDSMVTLRDLLVEKGRLLISIPASRTDISAEHRDAHDRLFSPITPNQLKLLCKRLALECIEEHIDTDSLGRAGTSWCTLLFVKQSAAGKPLDRIESVLRNDRKTASYKLALLRAFCDVADQDDHAVTWNPDGTIGIPILRLAELWFTYYWPLIAAPELIPQNTSEATGGKPIAFRQGLRDLIEQSGHFFAISNLASTELFSVFMLAWKNDSLPSELSKNLSALLKKISRAIVDGPVKYANSGEMFSYDKHQQRVTVESDLWLEFCLTGYWVRDSLILRWAELCERFGKSLPHVSMGTVMQSLAQTPEIEREQQIARGLYQQKPHLECVWSGRALTMKQMDVDHALPYSLWRNNDLWNLLPAYRPLNNKKRDNVPNSFTLLKSRDRIIDNWRFAHHIKPQIFEFEVTRTLGEFAPNYWEKPRFD
ncbi:MAG: methyltransferase domain-containing protein [Wenzhouxiangella sp.]|nr:methyltransferase domain-containing protein [Wenzhouxiangella sp.]